MCIRDSSREAALAIDGVHATRPIEYPVGPPKEAEGMFDLLTYEKGCAVLRMLEQYIGPEVFRDGVRTYLAAHAYANTVTTDLWDALEEASGEPVRDVMNTFILQGGHPLAVSYTHLDVYKRQVQQRRSDGHEIQSGSHPVVVHRRFSRFVCTHGARTYSERAG